MSSFVTSGSPRACASARARVVLPAAGMPVTMTRSGSAKIAEEKIEQHARVTADAFRVLVPLANVELDRICEPLEQALADQHLVDAAEAAAEGRVDRYAERDRLAVHRPPCRDDEVGKGDQALAVDRALWHEHRRQSQAEELLALFGRPRNHDRVHRLVTPEPVENTREELVRTPV